MVIYSCKNCNYRFESERAEECKFCGMECIEKEKSAIELLDDVDKLLKS